MRSGYFRGSLSFAEDGSRIRNVTHKGSSTYDIVTGACVAHVEFAGCSYSDGVNVTSILVLEDGYAVAIQKGVLFLRADGTIFETVVVDYGFRPLSLAYSPLLGGIVVTELCGTDRVVLLRDKWYSSLRCAWVTACVNM